MKNGQLAARFYRAQRCKELVAEITSLYPTWSTIDIHCLAIHVYVRSSCSYATLYMRWLPSGRPTTYAQVRDLGNYSLCPVKLSKVRAATLVQYQPFVKEI